jgi:hypothetical protein
LPLKNPTDNEARAIGSTLAHEVLKEIPSISSPNWDQAVSVGHGTIDKAFLTDLSIRYIYPTPPSALDNRWQSNVFLSQGEMALKEQNYESAVEHFGKAIESDPQNSDAYLQRAYAYMGMEEYDRSLDDFRTYTTAEPRPSLSLGNAVDFGVGFAYGLPKGIVESGSQLASFASELASHPIDTSCNVCHAFSTMAQLAYSQQWAELSQCLAPEVCQLVSEWDTLTSREQGERAGYVFGKYGGDILIPGTAAKVLSKGIEGAKEMVIVAKNLQTAEELFALDAVAQAGKFETPIHQMMIKAPAQPWTEAEIVKIKQTVFPSKYEAELRSRGVWEDFQRCKRAEIIIKPLQGKYLPENEVRKLIHEAGMPTFSRPAGIPENYRITFSDKGAGMKYVHPDHDQTYIRVMPGKPHSSFPCQQHPYIEQMKDGKLLDKFGNIVNYSSPEAHIPFNEFINRIN